MTKQNIEYKSIVKNMGAACVCYKIISDKKGKPIDIEIIDINQKFETLTGIKAKNIVGKLFAEVTSSLKRKNLYFHKLLHKIALTGKTDTIEQFIEPYNQWFRIQLFPLENKTFVIIFVNITRRKQAEQKILQLSEQWQSTFDAVNDGIFICDDKNHLIRWNKTLEHITKKKPEQFSSCHCWEIVHGLKRHYHDCLVVRAKKSLHRETMEVKIGNRDYQVVVDPVLDENRKFIGAVHLLTDITERKKIENALEDSEEKYRGLINNINVGIYRFSGDMPGEIFEANPAMAKLLGYNSVDELKHSAVVDLYQNPKDRKLTLNKLRKFGFIKNEERYLKRKDGTPIITSATAHVQKDKLGKIVWINGALEDITERRKAENALLESEEKYRGLVQNVNIGIFRTKPKGAGRFIEVNPALVHMFGYTSDKEFMRLSPTDLYHNPNDRNVYLKRLNKYGFVSGLELQHKKKDGTIITVSMTTRVHRNEKGKIDWVDGVIEDITDRKQKEEILREQANLLELAYDAIIVRTLDSAIIYWNQGAERTYGWTKKEVLGKISHTFLKTTFPVSEKVMNQTLNKHGQWEGELIHTRCDGSKIIVHSRMVLHYDSSGKPLNVLEINRDITERKQVEVSLRESEEKYRGLVNNVTIGIYRNIPDANGRFIDVNPAMVKMLGYKNQKELMGISIADLYQNLRDRDNLLKKIKQNRFVVGEELNLKKKDGTPIIIRLFARAHKNNKGKVDWIDGVMEDVTERRQAIEALHRREVILDAVAYAAERFLQKADWKSSIPEILARLGKAARVSRVYIFEKHTIPNSRLLTSQRYEWVEKGIAPQIDNPLMQNLDVKAAGFGRWIKILSNNQTLYGNIRDFPACERKFLSAQNILSIALVPIFSQETLWGFIGFDECLVEREWTHIEIDALKTAAGIIGSTIQKQLTVQLLSESEEKYRGLVQNVNIGIYRNTPGPQGKFIEINPAMCRIFGYASPQELKDITVSSLYQHPQRRKMFLKQITQNGLVKDFELTLKKKDGKIFIASVTARTHRDKNGKIDWIDGVIEDITERKQAERALRESEERYRTIFNTANDGICIISLSGKVISANQRLLALAGLSEKDLGLRITDYNLFPPNSLALIQKNIAARFAGKEVGPYEVEMHPRKGKPKIIEINGAIVRDSANKIIGDLVIIRDVTERKTAEQAFRESEQKFRTLVENSQDLIILRDSNDNIMYVSPACKTILGYDSEELIKKIPNIFHSLIHPDDREIVEKKLSSALDGITCANVEYRIITKNEQVKWLCHSRTPIIENGKVTMTVGLVRDISEHKEREELLKVAKETAETANQSKTSFLHNMSHELRSPMTSIIGFTDVLIDQEQNPEKQEMLEIVKNSSRYLLKIIDNLLDLSRIEAGRIKLEKSKCNIQELAQEICKRYELLAQEKGIDFRLNINKSVPRFIIIDNTKLNQIIANLLDNAFKFTDRGKIESHLALKSSPKTKQPILEIIIKDTGIGIAPDRLDKIFERFEQGEFYISKKYGGAGLGLPITKELTQLMQGTIAVQSKLAQGTKFTVRIPVTIVED